MSSAQDPFYIVKEEIQESIDKLQFTFHRWERMSSDTGEQVHLTRELLASSESIEWQVDELDKTISVAARDPSWYGIDEAELEKRRRWTSTARTQVGNVKKAVIAGREMHTSSAGGMRKELMRLPDAPQTDKYNHYSEDNDNFIQSESDRQMLLIKYSTLSPYYTYCEAFEEFKCPEDFYNNCFGVLLYSLLGKLDVRLNVAQ